MTPALAPSGFDTPAFEAFLATRNEPAWLTQRRQEAFAAFQAADWPARNDEEWMRTDIRLFKLNDFSLAPERTIGPLESASLLDRDVDLAGCLHSVDGATIAEEGSQELADQGALFGDLERLVAEESDKLRPIFDRQITDPMHDRFAMLHAAFWSGGLLLYVPRRAKLERPLHVISLLQSANAADFSKTLVVLEEGAEATLLMETASQDSSLAGLHCGSIELAVGPGARLRCVNLQNWGKRVWHFAHQRAEVERMGRLQWTIGALGARLAKVNQQVALTGIDAEAQVNGVLFTQGRQHLSYNTHQHHQAPHGRSDLLYKAALQDVSRTVWRGMIKVDEQAQRTDAYQRNDNLMLARTARADSIPGLEIEADDVRCTHGSTSGRVDDEQIYYAMSRGYTRQEAVRMIVSGFFQQIFDRISIESVREALGDAIGARVKDLKGE